MKKIFVLIFIGRHARRRHDGPDHVDTARQPLLGKGQGAQEHGKNDDDRVNGKCPREIEGLFNSGRI